MLKTYETVLKEMQSQQWEAVYFFHGEESYFIDTLSQWVADNALPANERAFNQTILYGKDITTGSILQQARRFPMMAERQVVIIKEFQQLPDLNKSESKKLLEEYVSNPLTSTILVFCHKHKTLAKNLSLYKILEKQAIVVECKKLAESKLPAWMNQYIQTKGYEISPKAQQLLTDAIGADLSRLQSELDKICLGLAQGKAIDERIIEERVGISREFNIFELQKAIAQADIAKAFRIQQYWATNPKAQPLIVTLGVLFQFFCKTLIAHQTSDKSEYNLARTLGIPPFAVKDYLMATKKYSPSQLVQIVGTLRQADLQLKGITARNLPEAEILKELLIKVLYA